MDGVSPYLPQEIVRNILKRLPVRSLIRFQCVCKDWKNLSKTSSFVEEHLQHSNHQNPSLLFQMNARGDPLHLYSLDHDMQVLEIQNPPLINSMFSVRIVGSSNGLICVEGSNFSVVHSLFLWNLAIREVRRVPNNVYDFEGDLYIGFGFSPIVNDYKILRACAPISDDHNEINRVEVYSLSSGRWGNIEFGNLKGINLYSETVTANGAMFWLGSQIEDEDDLLVSFDMAMEVFTLIPMPALDSGSDYNLAVYENKLALLSYTVVGNSGFCLIDLWVMDDGRDWNKKYSISTFSSVFDPSCIWRNEIVCNVDEMHGFISEFEPHGVTSVLSLLNLGTNKLREIATRRCGNKFSVIFNHAESIVPIGNIRIEEP
ncbi:F-box/kelch-repeat protein At3g06240-like [Prosopis cineraria]|uniref:F-box/kelch-repeat protein At3g06240-like n=1 Tax=Prosopis cineraria TaxID=364024 RepID=UPI00240ED194|nr:F-box/kelch-repeat protein At3g06240-like [Prosopis cineraria]